MSRFTYRLLRALCMNIGLAIITTLFVLGVATQTAHAIQCGDLITTDTKLYADIGPCPGDGLIIQVDAGGQSVTLDLNGHTITGSGSGVGVHPSGPQDVNIKGPGRISNFATGISIRSQTSANVLVYDLTLMKNQFGIAVSDRFSSSMIRLLRNTILGTNQTSVGIYATSESGELHIYQNTISGHSVGVWLDSELDAMLDENLITLNQTGVFAKTNFACLTLRGNKIMLNRGNGIYAAGGSPYPQVETAIKLTTCAAPPGNIIQDNTVTFNGENGIVLNSGYGATQVIQDNIVQFNKAGGISTITVSPNGTIQVVGNYASHNGTDLLWDGVNTNSCWEQNIFDSSSPSTLPGC